MVYFFKSIGKSNNLNYLANLYKTDKWGKHFYTPHYFTHFNKFRNEKINLFEIGVGGYDSPFHGGASLRMWKRFFPKGRIFSLDIYDKSPQNENRIKIFKGSQVDTVYLDTIVKEMGDLDIIIDDGSHLNEHVIVSFLHLFPKLKDGGIYVVEDVQTSYWPKYGGDSQDLSRKDTIMGFFKSLTDGLNHVEFVKESYEKSYFDKNIISIHFYHNMIFIYKGKNDELSNFIKDNTYPD